MDPISQGVIGAIGATQASKKTHLGIATLLGFASGMTPDLDILIRSASDPLIALEYHRQFTHSLIYIPFGGLLCAVLFYFLFARKHLSFKQTFLFCVLGVATHGLLDAFTTYGTQLFWPFSDVRIAFNTISIIDPLFTLPLLFLILINIKFKQKAIAFATLGWAVFYLSLGFIQRERAEAAGWELANARSLDVIKLEAKPSFANLLVWKIVATTEDKYYVDAIKVGLADAVIFEGDSVDKLDIDRDFPGLDKTSQQAKDIERFRWFSNGYLAMSPTKENTVIDMRYSMLPNEIKGLWGIRIDPDADAEQHIEYVESTERDPGIFKALWAMIKA